LVALAVAPVALPRLQQTARVSRAVATMASAGMVRRKAILLMARPVGRMPAKCHPAFSWFILTRAKGVGAERLGEIEAVDLT